MQPHRTVTRTRHLRPAVTAAGSVLSVALLLTACGDDGSSEDPADADDAAAAETDATSQEGEDGQSTSDEATDSVEAADSEDAGGTDAEEGEDGGLDDFQPEIEMPSEITELIELPEDFEPDTLFKDIEDPSAGTLETVLGGPVAGEPDILRDEVDAAVAASGLGEVATEELTAEGNPRTRFQWRTEGDGTSLAVDLVTEEGADGGDLKVVVVRPMP